MKTTNALLLLCALAGIAEARRQTPAFSPNMNIDPALGETIRVKLNGNLGAWTLSPGPSFNRRVFFTIEFEQPMRGGGPFSIGTPPANIKWLPSTYRGVQRPVPVLSTKPGAIDRFTFLADQNGVQEVSMYVTSGQTVDFGSYLTLRNSSSVIRANTLWPDADGNQLGEPTVPLRWQVFAFKVEADEVRVHGQPVATVDEVARWQGVFFLAALLGSLVGLWLWTSIRLGFSVLRQRRYLAREAKKKPDAGPYRGPIDHERSRCGATDHAVADDRVAPTRVPGPGRTRS